MTKPYLVYLAYLGMKHNRHQKLRQYFLSFVHFWFIVSLAYAVIHFAWTPRSNMDIRRLWAYESWIIFSFYGLFVYLILTDPEYADTAREKARKTFTRFQRTLKTNLLLLLVPWGLFLLAARYIPGGDELLAILGMDAVYWQVLGGMSLLGFLLYLFPYLFFRNRLTYPILIFGFIDNFVAAMIVMVLFSVGRVPFVAFSATPLLMYFSYFFWEQAKHYKELRSALKNRV